MNSSPQTLHLTMFFGLGLSIFKRFINSSGKTTTINVLTTRLPIQKGKISISGFDLRTQPDEIRKSIGIVFQSETLDWNLTVEETLEVHGRLYTIPKKTRKDRINELIQIVELEDKRKEFVKIDYIKI